MSSKERSYTHQLHDRVRALKKKIETLEAEVYTSDTFDKDWMHNYKVLSNLRLDLATAKSRLENIGKNRDGLETTHIDRNYLNR